MQQSNFITLIKKETDKLVDAWNDAKQDITLANLGNIQLLISLYFCLYTDEVTVFNIEVTNKEHSLFPLIQLASLLFETKQSLVVSELTDKKREQLEQELELIEQQIEQLTITDI